MRQVNPVLLNQLKADFEEMKRLGSPLLQSQGMLVPRDIQFQSHRLLITQMQRPMVKNADPSEQFLAGGTRFFVPGTPETMYEASIQMIETEGGSASMFAEFIVANGGEIACDYYDGRLGSFTRAYALDHCAIRLDAPDMSAEGRSQGVTVSGSMSYMYFGAFASVGRNNTARPGLKGIDGVEALVERVQSVLTATQRITSGVGAIAGGIGAIRGLLG